MKYRSGVYIHRGAYRTNVLSYIKLIGHLSSSQLNEADIFLLLKSLKIQRQTVT